MAGRPFTRTNLVVGKRPGSAEKMRRVGFSPDQIRFLLDEDRSLAEVRRKYKHVFPHWKVQALDTADAASSGDKLRVLLTHGKFSRPQAKVLVDLGVV